MSNSPVQPKTHPLVPGLGVMPPYYEMESFPFVLLMLLVVQVLNRKNTSMRLRECLLHFILLVEGLFAAEVEFIRSSSK